MATSVWARSTRSEIVAMIVVVVVVVLVVVVVVVVVVFVIAEIVVVLPIVSSLRRFEATCPRASSSQSATRHTFQSLRS